MVIHRLEADAFIQNNKGTKCSCGGDCLGSISTKTGGFFSKSVKRKNYFCVNCGNEWSTDWISIGGSQ